MKSVFRKVNGVVTERAVREADVAKFLRRGWSASADAFEVEQPKPKRGRPKKETTDADEA